MDSSKQPNKVLILALSGIGNFIMQSPVFPVLKKIYPDAAITVWVAPRGTKALAQANPYIDEIIEAHIKQSPFGHFKLTWQLVRGHYDVGIILSPGQLWKSAAYLFLAGISTRVGHMYPFRGETKSSFLLTNTIPEQKGLHDIEQNLNLVQLLQPSYVLPAKEIYSVSIPSEALAKAQDVLKAINIPSTKKIIGIHAGSAPDFLWKRWPIDRFIAVCQELIANHNAHILVFGGSDEEEQKQYIKQALGDASSFVSTDLLTTAAVMQHCTLVLSNDSGLMHLAAAAGVQTFGLFGPTDERETGPRGEHSHVIRLHRPT